MYDSVNGVINFIDPIFEAEVRKVIDKPNGDISKRDVEGIMSLNLNKDITNIVELKYFTNLEELSIDGSNLENIDLSSNRKIKRISGFDIKELNIKNNSALTHLDLFHCPSLNELDLSRNPLLELLACCGTGIIELDLRYNPLLENIFCGGMGFLGPGSSLTKIDLCNNSILKRFECQRSNLTELDLKNNSELIRLNCSDCELTELDLSNNKMLEILGCGGNKISKLNLRNNPALKSICCDYNNLTELDLRHNTEIEVLSCSHNQLTKLDVSGKTQLKYLRCENNQLSELKTDGIPVLEGFSYENNHLLELDVKVKSNFNYFLDRCKSAIFFACQIFMEDNTLVLIKNDYEKLASIDEPGIFYFAGTWEKPDNIDDYCYLITTDMSDKDRGSLLAYSPNRHSKIKKQKSKHLFGIFELRITEKLDEKGIDSQIIEPLYTQLYKWYEEDDLLRAVDDEYKKFPENWKIELERKVTYFE